MSQTSWGNFLIQKKRGKNELWNEIRQESKVTENVLKSIQSCFLKDNLSTLNEHIPRLLKDEGNRVINSSLINHLKGLWAILQMLLAQVPNQHGKEIINSYMDLKDAFNLYMAYSDTASSLSLDIKHEKRDSKSSFVTETMDYVYT